MRIAIITDSYLPTTDGVVTAVLTTRRSLEALGHTVFIIAPDPGPEYREEGVYYFPAMKLRTYEGYYIPIFPSEKVTLLKKLNPDIIQVRGVAFMAVKALIASKQLDIPIIINYDTAVTEVVDQYSPIKLSKDILVNLTKKYLRKILARANAVIAPTNVIAKEILNDVGALPKKIGIIPTGIDTEFFTRSDAGNPLREKYGLVGKRVLLSVGRLSVEKSVDRIIRVLRKLPEDTVLLIVGKGPMENDLKKLVEDEGLTDRVKFLGYLHGQDLVDHYSCADAYVSASMFETQVLTVLESI